MNDEQVMPDERDSLLQHDRQDERFDREAHAALVLMSARAAHAGETLPCEECDQPIFFAQSSWLHVDKTDVPHLAVPACTCDSVDGYDIDIDPLCRQHGHEDVRSGAYDASPKVRAEVDAEMVRMMGRDQ